MLGVKNICLALKRVLHIHEESDLDFWCDGFAGSSDRSPTSFEVGRRALVCTVGLIPVHLVSLYLRSARNPGWRPELTKRSQTSMPSSVNCFMTLQMACACESSDAVRPCQPPVGYMQMSSGSTASTRAHHDGRLKDSAARLEVVHHLQQLAAIKGRAGLQAALRQK
jgi:hypothetical protein